MKSMPGPTGRGAEAGARAESTPESAHDFSGFLQRNLLWTGLVLLLAVGGVTWYFVNDSQNRLIEYKALDLAEVVARQAAASRSAYAEHVVAKLKRDGSGGASEGYQDELGNVPLAQFLKLVGERASADSGGLYRYQPLSSWTRRRPTLARRVPALGLVAARSTRPAESDASDRMEVGLAPRATQWPARAAFPARRPGLARELRAMPQRARTS